MLCDLGTVSMITYPGARKPSCATACMHRDRSLNYVQLCSYNCCI
jgi:hypothetical protein